MGYTCRVLLSGLTHNLKVIEVHIGHMPLKDIRVYHVISLDCLYPCVYLQSGNINNKHVKIRSLFEINFFPEGLFTGIILTLKSHLQPTDPAPKFRQVWLPGDTSVSVPCSAYLVRK